MNAPTVRRMLVVGAELAVLRYDGAEVEGFELAEGIKVGILEGNTVGIAVNVGLEVELGA